MIVEALFNLITSVFDILLIVFEILPDTPEKLRTVVNFYFSTVFEHLDFISFFVNVDTLRTVAIACIAVYSFEKAFSFLMWLLRKIPFVSIS